MTKAASAEHGPRGELTVRLAAMPGDTNANGDIFGGWVLNQMDLAGGIAAAETQLPYFRGDFWRQRLCTLLQAFEIAWVGWRRPRDFAKKMNAILSLEIRVIRDA